MLSAPVNIRIQGSSRAYLADNLFSGMTCRSFLMKILASFEIVFHSGVLKLM